MTYGILGNTRKEAIWQQVADLVQWLLDRDLPFRLQYEVAEGLSTRGLIDPAVCVSQKATDLAAQCDVLLSFGGDGTFLQTAHVAGEHGTPILGVNLGRLGFLTKIEVSEVQQSVERIETNEYRLGERGGIAVDVPGAPEDFLRWALNDVVIAKTGTASMITIEAEVDGAYLNTYRADGLIVATPTGSTAYSLSADGPIIEPSSNVVVLTPIAPHTLTARPIVLPNTATITLRVTTPGPYLVALDGQSIVVDEPDQTITVRQAEHAVQLVSFPDRDYFSLLRDKLKWGEERRQ